MHGLQFIEINEVIDMTFVEVYNQIEILYMF